MPLSVCTTVTNRTTNPTQPSVTSVVRMTLSRIVLTKARKPSGISAVAAWMRATASGAAPRPLRAAKARASSGTSDISALKVSAAACTCRSSSRKPLNTSCAIRITRTSRFRSPVIDDSSGLHTSSARKRRRRAPHAGRGLTRHPAARRLCRASTLRVSWRR